MISTATKARGSKALEKAKQITNTSMKFGKFSDDAGKIAIYEYAKSTKEGRALLKSYNLENPEQLIKDREGK